MVKKQREDRPSKGGDDIRINRVFALDQEGGAISSGARLSESGGNPNSKTKRRDRRKLVSCWMVSYRESWDLIT